MEQIERKDEQTRDGATTGPGRIYYGWVVVAACFFVIAVVSPLIASFSIFQAPVQREFNWSRGNIAIALAIHLVLGGVASPFAGNLVDRFGPRRVMPIGAIITAAALMCLSQATALWHFYLAFGVIAAAGSSLLQIVPLTTIVSNWFVRSRGTAIGIVTAGSGAGQLALLSLMQYLINQIGWRQTYLAFGAAIFTIPTTLIWLFLYARPEDRGLSVEDDLRARPTRQREEVILDKQWAETDWTVSKAVRTFRFWALTLVMALFAAGFFLISVQLVAYLEDKGYNSLLAASVMGLQGLLNMAGKFVGGIMSDRLGRERTLTLSIVVFVASIALLNLVGSVVSPALVYVFVIFYGIGFGMAVPALMASAADIFQGKHFGSILGVVILGGFIGGAIGTWMGGRLFDLTHGYQLNFLVAGLTMLVSAALIWKARPGRVRLLRSVQKD